MEVNVLHQMFASANLAGTDPPVVQVKSELFSITLLVKKILNEPIS